jgi:hypothetical protein
VSQVTVRPSWVTAIATATHAGSSVPADAPMPSRGTLPTPRTAKSVCVCHTNSAHTPAVTC